MASRISYLLVLAVWIGALWIGLDFATRPKPVPTAVPTTEVDWADFFAANILPNLPVADEFDTPLRPPDGAGAVITLPFLEEGHLGEDWTTAPGDAALGEPVYSLSDGWVSVAFTKVDVTGTFARIGASIVAAFDSAASSVTTPASLGTTRVLAGRVSEPFEAAPPSVTFLRSARISRALA